MLLLVTAFWGSSFPLMKSNSQLIAVAVPEGGTWFNTTMMLMPRFLIAATVLAIVLGPGLFRMTRLELQQGLKLGAFAAGGMLLQGDGLQFTSASTSAFLTQFYALLIPLWVAWRTRRNPGRWVWASAALVLAGVAILGEFDWRTFRMGRGEAETLLASVFFMGQILTLERPEYVHNRVVPITLIMFLVQGLVFLVLAAVSAPSFGAMLVPLTVPAWWGLSVALVLLCTLGSFLLMNRWQREISSTEAGMLYCIEPVFASALALVLPVWLSRWAGIDYPNEVLGTHLLLGGGLILAANVLLQLRPLAQPKVSD